MAGYEADHVNRIAPGAASDGQILARAIETKAAIVTEDADFPTLPYGMDHYPQIVWVRVGSATNAGIRPVFDRVLHELMEALELGEADTEVR